ncbi:dynamin family protein [Sulfurihydrogenibium subterraneum]|uniref:dynamin family protein n=1 Tax=Sulfurihydrogenibium subterraneum TaxID=171121 RepID=UPI00048D922B|nr:dynamin family protein [Sulfurihydrogenibium subterraneum]
MEQELKVLRNNILFLRNEYLEKLCDVAIDVIKRDKIEVIFVGKLSTGKSTIMNALLDRNIMPTGIGTITKSINTVIKSDEDKIEVIYKDGNSEVYQLNEKSFELINGKANIKAVNVYLKDFPFSSVIFVDTPGIDELQENLENLTLSRIPTADAVVFVLDISKGLTKKDKEFFNDYIIKFLRDKIFIVFNKLDLVKDEVDEEQIQNVKKDLEGFTVFVFSAKEKDKDFFAFKNQLFNYLSETSKSQIIKSRINSIIKAIEEVSKKQLNSLIENKQKTKEELQSKLSELKMKKAELDNTLNDLRKKVEVEILDIINNKIVPLIDNKRIEVITKVKNMDPDNLKTYLSVNLRNEIQSLIVSIKENLNKSKFDFNIAELSGIGSTSSFTSFILSSIDILGKILDPLLKRFNLPDLTDVIQDLIKTLAMSNIEDDINKIFDKIKENIIYSIESSKDYYFEELKLREHANLDSEIVSTEKSIEFIGKDKEEIENELKFYESKIKVIEDTVNNIRSILESKVI